LPNAGGACEGYILLKENVCKDETERLFDDDDSSYTRYSRRRRVRRPRGGLQSGSSIEGQVEVSGRGCCRQRSAAQVGRDDPSWPAPSQAEPRELNVQEEGYDLIMIPS
jgi:hypothetical protein